MSTMTNFPSFSTMREWYLETFPLPRTMSFPANRPIVTSFFSNVSCWLPPPFSASVMRNMAGILLGLGGSIEDAEADLAARLLVAVLHVFDDRPDLVGIRVDDPGRHEDDELPLGR